MKVDYPQCALCPYDAAERFCKNEQGKGLPNCPTIRDIDLAVRALEAVRSESICEFARQAEIQVGEGYGFKEEGNGPIRAIKPRILEVIEFSNKMNYNRVALIFCIGLRREAVIVHRLFESYGLEVMSVICKVGRTSKEEIGITEDQKVHPGVFESMCNPVMQAHIANRYGSQFNILLGLCVGHDSLFFKHADAPCTVLAVKDRLLAHNPLAAVYQLDSYSRYVKAPSRQDAKR